MINENLCIYIPLSLAEELGISTRLSMLECVKGLVKYILYECTHSRLCVSGDTHCLGE
jgi:hypothetical protein